MSLELGIQVAPAALLLVPRPLAPAARRSFGLRIWLVLQPMADLTRLASSVNYTVGAACAESELRHSPANSSQDILCRCLEVARFVGLVRYGFSMGIHQLSRYHTLVEHSR